MKISSVFAATVALCVASTMAQSEQDKTLTGTITMKTRGRTTAVHGKGTASGEFLFCIDQDRSGTPQSLDFAGPGRVVYRPRPGPDMPEGIVITGPENVASTLAVVAENGQAWLFIGKGEQPVLRPGDPALAKATTVNVSLVRRSDWAPERGARRGTDLAGCLAPGG